MSMYDKLSSAAVLLVESLELMLSITWCIMEVTWTRFVSPAARRKNISGRVVLVTGAASGLGRQLALGFAALGARLVLWDINQEGNEETAILVEKMGGEAHAEYCDVRSRQSIRHAGGQLRERLGVSGVDLLVNNAGVMPCRELLTLSEHEITNTFRTNSLAHFWTVQEFLPDMMAARYGHIVNISSMSGVQGVAMTTDYSASKFAVMGFTESLEDELYRGGFSEVIKTTVACPYMVNTPLLNSIQHRVRPKARFDRVMEPEEVAEQVIDAVLTDTRLVYIPSKTGVMSYLKTLLPHTALRKIMNFADTGFYSVDNKERMHGL